MPVVPTLIEGAFEALPKGRLLPKRTKIRVTFGEPVKVEMLVTDQKILPEIPPSERRELNQRLTEEVRQRIVAMQRQDYPPSKGLSLAIAPQPISQIGQGEKEKGLGFGLKKFAVLPDKLN